jgi:RNA polymerase sigma-70 factor (ECF subfamily)
MSADKSHTPTSSGFNPRTECPDFAEMVKQTTPDRSLFEQITLCFSDRLEDFAKYYCRDDTLGKDAFQDAMISAMHYLDTYRGDSPIEPWLRRIVMSACSRLRRGKKNSPSVNISLESDKGTIESADDAPDQELRMMLRERLLMVQEEMEKLKEPNRTLLMLHDIEEVSISDLQNRFELTEESVKSRLKRARAQVRDKLIARNAA